MTGGQSIPSGIVCAADWERAAETRLDPGARAYLGPAADGLTALANRRAFDDLALVPRVLRDCSGGSTATVLLGAPVAFPILVAPVAHQGLFAPEAEAGAAMAAAALGTIMVASTLSTLTLEQIAGHGADGHRWFQLYVQRDRGLTAELAARARAAGYGAIMLTVDAPVVATRNAEQRLGFRTPPAGNLAGRPMPPAPGGHRVFEQAAAGQATWSDLEWLAAHAGLPVIVKGVLSPADATRALDLGAAGIVVSNHGGRVLDGAIASIAALPAIVDAVAGRAPILLDGGVRRGTDALKSIALGASAVMVGRPVAAALAVAGGLGVAHLLALMADELAAAMVQTGCRTLAEIDRSLVARRG
jgi:4-hydroxymandelate oxidase